MSKCFHCGDNCDTIIHFDQKMFCCNGCKTVYDILNGANLDDYYNLEETKPGLKTQKQFKDKFNFLELPEFRNKFIVFEEGSIAKVNLFLPQIHCSSCLWLLERLDKLTSGVISSQVYFIDKKAEITFDETKLTLKGLVELLASIGYPPSLTLEDYDQKEKPVNDKSLIFKIGLTGFCFGNVMLLSFPEYLGINSQDHNFQVIFNYLNLIFSIPVLIFGAKDFIVSAYRSIEQKRINIDVPISIGIFALYLRSLYEVLFEQGAGYFDSFIGLIFFLLIGRWFQQSTYRAINFERDYKSYFPIAVNKVNNGGDSLISLEAVKPGDILRIRNSELIPADAILKEGQGNIDYSFVTGESIPIEKKFNEKLFAGGRQMGTAIEIEIIKKIENSYLTQLWNNPVFDKIEIKERLSDIVSRRFTILLLVIALVSSIVWYFIDPGQMAFVAVSILIVACPCAIALSVPFTFGNGIRILGRKGVYLRAAEVIEPMAKTTDIVFDKTGTITQNNLSSIQWEGEPLTKSLKEIIRRLTDNSSHPLSRQIAASFDRSYLGEITSFEELNGKGIAATVEGDNFRIGNKNWLNLNFEDEKTRVCLVMNTKYLGSFIVENSYRYGLKKLLMDLNGQAYQLHVLSGDNSAELSRLTQLFPDQSNFKFNQKPEDKLNYIKSLQESGKQVMMIGDGLNDAGALQQANTGVSVVDDVYAFTPSSDVILNGNKLHYLNTYLRFSKSNINIVKLSYFFSIVYNIIGLGFAVTGHLEPLVAAILMPLSSISIVLLVTVLTNLKGRQLP